MSVATRPRRGEAELDPGAATSGCPGIGSRSIHQFWHLFSAHFRGVLLPPRRRADSGKIAWGWREPAHNPPVTATELADVRRRLAQASRAFTGGTGAAGGVTRRIDEGDDQAIEVQVRARVEQMTADLMAKSDAALAGYIGRDEAGPMIHSWGAATPAQPVYPDARQNEISGRVVMDGPAAAGLSIVLENKSGLRVAHAKTDRAGSFRFPDIAPGHYRLRVVDRDGFSAEGLPVVMEQSSLTGVELRAVTSLPLTAVAKPSPAEPKPRRHLGLLALLLLLVAGVGVGWWRYRGVEPTVTATGKPAGGWQSAQGDGGALSDVTTQDVAAKVRGGDHRLESVGKVSAPALTAARPVQDEKPSLDRVGRRGVSAGAGAETPGGNADERTAPPRADEAGAGGRLSPAAAPVLPADRLDRSAPVRSPDPTDLEPKRLAVTGEAAGKMVAASGPGSDPINDEEAEATSSGARLFAKPETRAPDAGAATETQAAVTPDATGSGEARMSKSNMLSLASSGPAATGAGSGTGVTSDSVAQSAGARRKGASGATNGTGTTVVAASGGLGAAGLSPVNAADHESPQATAPESSVAEPDRQTEKSGTTDQASRNLVGSRVAGTDAENPESSVLSSAAPDLSTAVAAGAVSDQDELRLQGRINASGWQPRLMRDEILPTLPVPEGQAEELPALRQERLRAQQTQMPVTIAAPRIWSGFVLDVSNLSRGSHGLLRWRVESGGESARSEVKEGRAEIAWAATGPARGAVYVLGWSEGGVVARVSVEADGRLAVRAAAGVHTWYWVGVECAAAEQAGRFIWQQRSGAALPAGWSRDDSWHDGRGRRLEIPLRGTVKPKDRQGLALVDSLTDWALTCRISVE